MKKKRSQNQSYFDPQHIKRSYRQIIKATDLISYQIQIAESDLFIQTPLKLEKEAMDSLKQARSIIEEYIRRRPIFQKTLIPYPMDLLAHPIIKQMISASTACQVGPMATVAGCIAQYVAQSLLSQTDAVLVENGGDLFLQSIAPRRIVIYAGSSVLSNKIFLKIKDAKKGISICTSSGTVGPSFSRGKADAVTVLSSSGTLADAAATAIGNIIQKKEDIAKGLAFAKTITGLTGIIIIKADQIGLWGDIDYGFLKN